MGECCEHCSGNSKVLAVVILLFGSITAAQFLAAIAAGSDALLVDCGSMLVDTCTYLVNLCAERYRGQVTDLCASGISILVLLAVSMSGILEAINDLTHPHEGEKLTPQIVLLFGLVGICVDLLSFWGFYRWGWQSVLGDFGTRSPMGSPLADSMSPGSRLMASPVAVNDAMSPSSRMFGSSSMNMRSAFMHVGADLLRSVVTVTEGLLVIFWQMDGRSTDSVASLIVSFTILCGVGVGVMAWSKQAWQFCTSRRSTDELLRAIPLAEYIREPP
ncbi:unnamed protein product [Durusdinium trenchii]|uniref:Cation efflux protein transmembrane domain-containing protein n=1 Tax=Durusdinium trenchii TaxID=1381693 RepID=A0ABP0I574_9DINO